MYSLSGQRREWVEEEMTISEGCEECPSPFPGGRLGQGRAGKEPGKETIAHPELGLWVRLESGNSVGVRSGEGG